MTLLDGKKVLVCGGSSGIGFATAKQLLDTGADITIAARAVDRLQAASEKLGGAVKTAPVDFAEPSDVRAFFDETGPFDHAVISLAGNAALGAFVDTDVSGFRETFEGKFWPYLTALQESAKHLNEKGSITLVTGASAIAATPGAASLAAV